MPRRPLEPHFCDIAITLRLDDTTKIRHTLRMAADISKRALQEQTPLRFLLLMRHMSHDEKRADAQAKEIATGLHDYVEETKKTGAFALRLGLCLHPKEGAAEASAKKLQKALFEHGIGIASRPLESAAETDPLNPHERSANPYIGRAGSTRRRRVQVRKLNRLLDPIKKGSFTRADLVGNNAVLVIGHSPQIDWLLHELVAPSIARRWRPWYQHAFATGEIVCVDLRNPSPLKRRPRARPIWSLAPTDNETGPLLREKIEGKMESAKLLGGIVAAGIGFVLTGFHELAFGWAKTLDDAARLLHLKVHDLDGERVIFFGLSMLALLLATGLYCSAYLSYDRLLMPTRFWAAAEPPHPRWRGIVWRPPSSSLLVMHQNMQRVWFRAFIPATFATGIGLVLLTYAAIIQQIADTVGSTLMGRIYFGVGSLLLAIVLLVCHRIARPVLGSQD